MTAPGARRPRLWVQVCNERLLPRFGVDRLMTLAGRFFQQHDIEVSYLCLRHDPSLLDAGQDRVTVLPVPAGLDIRATEQHVTRSVLTGWLGRKPDAILVGGWPFFELAGRAAALGVRSVFIDAGAVPHDGLEGHALWPQLALRRQRQMHLPSIGAVLPISDFIRDTQTLPDRGEPAGVRTVLLGSDHLQALPAPPSGTGVVQAARSFRQAGRKLLLNLGRFEDQGYKNSPAFFDVLASLARNGVDAVGLILATADEATIPAGLEGSVLCLGRISDAEMLAIMHESHLGLSMSLWEGFNLPLAEMQDIGKPVLAFNAGAHPEVIAHPWQLCRDEADMVARAVVLLRGEADAARTVLRAVTAFKGRLRWSDTLGSWLDVVRGVDTNAFTGPKARHEAAAGRRMLLVDVSNSAQDAANSGVVRVTRQLARRLKDDGRFDVVFVRWNAALHTYTVLPGPTQLGQYGGPTDVLGPMAAAIQPQFGVDTLLFGRDPRSATPPLALISEVVLDGTIHERQRWLRYRGFLVSALLYDLIPVCHPEYCHPSVVEGFASYLDVLHSFDQCISISGHSMADFLRHARQAHASVPASLATVWLPAQLGQWPRVLDAPLPGGGALNILCVSTLEPRKNHRRLLQAFRLLVARRPDLPLKLVLVGNSYVGSEDLVAAIDRAREDGVPVERLGIVSDEELVLQYRRARFTVYGSLVEGFGIPIVESLWLGRPCLCASGGVMAELAAGGGCLTVDMNNPAAISDAMERLAVDDALHARLCEEATTRELSSWQAYARRIGDTLDGLGNVHATVDAGTRLAGGEGGSRAYLEAMFDGAPLAHRQFQESVPGERP